MKVGVKGSVLVLLFISGFCSLVYQVLFTRLFNITFGLFIHSTVLVVITYMLGLALGYYLSRNISPKNHLSFYGYLELVIGLYAILILILFKPIDNLYTTLGNSIVVKFVLSSLILVLPTTAMGITIPVVVEYLKKTQGQEMVEKVYGINALGASVGALVSSVVFINLLGLIPTFIVAFVLNVIVFLGAIYLAKSYSPSFSIVKSDIRFVSVGLGFGIVAFLYGFSGMALEILWYRMLVYFVANNTFSFSIILSVVILGIAVGSLFYKHLLKAFKNDFNLLFVVSLFTGLYTTITILILNGSYSIMGSIYNIFGNIVFGILGDNKVSETITLNSTRYTLVLITSGIVSLSSGIIIPSLFNLIRGYVSEKITSQSISGTILAINTLGSILGAFLMTYLMIPNLGFGYSILTISLIYIASGFVILATLGCNRILGSIGVVVAILTLIIPKEITFTKYYSGFFDLKGELKFYKEGMYGTVAVFDVNNTRHLKINGIDEVPNDYNSLIAFKVLGNIPFLFSRSHSNVMVNALGGGITLSSVLHNTDARVEVVDICPDITDALELYKGYNDNIFVKTNWFFTPEDGRNFLKSYNGAFDIIVADATHPASSESWMLFTKEFYELAYSKLSENGVFAQWIPVHNLETYDYVSILKTIKSVFSNSILLITGVYTVVVSKKGEFDGVFSEIDFGDLMKLGIDKDSLKSLIFLSPELFSKLVGSEEGEILNDYKSSVEFAEFHRRVVEDTKPKNLELILKYSDYKKLSEFTGLDHKKHQSMILAKKALVDYQNKLHYEALKKIDEGIRLDSKNFYINFLFVQIFPEFVQFVRDNERQIRERYGDNVYYELVRYIQQKMNLDNKTTRRNLNNNTSPSSTKSRIHN